MSRSHLRRFNGSLLFGKTPEQLWEEARPEREEAARATEKMFDDWAKDTADRAAKGLAPRTQWPPRRTRF